MASKSTIEWTEMTWNPVTGCTKVSEGCRHCYAERLAKRLQAMDNRRYANGFRLTLHEDLVDLPRSWKQQRMIFFLLRCGSCRASRCLGRWTAWTLRESPG